MRLFSAHAYHRAPPRTPTPPALLDATPGQWLRAPTPPALLDATPGHWAARARRYVLQLLLRPLRPRPQNPGEQCARLCTPSTLVFCCVFTSFFFLSKIEKRDWKVFSTLFWRENFTTSHNFFIAFSRVFFLVIIFLN